MDSNRVITVLLSLLVILGVYFVVYFSGQPSVTQVFYQQEETSQELDSAFSDKNNSKSNSKNHSSKTASEEELGESQDSSEISQENINMYESSLSVNSEESHNEANSSSSVSDMSSQSPSESVPENDDFSPVLKQIEYLEAVYGILLNVNTNETPISDLGQAYTDADEVMEILYELKMVLGRLPDGLFHGMREKGLETKFIITRNFLSHSAAELFYEGNAATIIIDADFGEWFPSFYRKLSYRCDRALAEVTNLSDIYYQYERNHPEEFHYGSYYPELIRGKVEQTCFLNIAAQVSIEADREYLFSAYYNKVIPQKYMTEDCPLFRKALEIENALVKYLCQ